MLMYSVRVIVITVIYDNVYLNVNDNIEATVGRCRLTPVLARTE